METKYNFKTNQNHLELLVLKYPIGLQDSNGYGYPSLSLGQVQIALKVMKLRCRAKALRCVLYHEANIVFLNVLIEIHD
jgi:hypothetical protein